MLLDVKPQSRDSGAERCMHIEPIVGEMLLGDSVAPAYRGVHVVFDGLISGRIVRSWHVILPCAVVERGIASCRMCHPREAGEAPTTRSPPRDNRGRQ